MSNNSIVTYNPAASIFKQRNDLGALAAENAYKTYYEARSTGNPNPCAAMKQSIRDTVKRYMSKKEYPVDMIEAYSKYVVEDLVQKCEKHIFKVQELAGKVDNSMKNRWQTYTRRAGARQQRQSGRKRKTYKRK
jgi:hypothetical protein